MTLAPDQPELTPSDIASSDELRSQVARQLIVAAQTPVAKAGVVVPRLLIQFWDKAASVPEDVQRCIESWLPLEDSGLKRLLFDDETAERFISQELGERHALAFSRCQHPAMRSDYFRLCFMLKRGGLYVDADDVYLGEDLEPLFLDGRLQLQPLCYDISSDSMLDPITSALDLDDMARLRIFYFNNNPIVSAPNNPILAAALERSTALLLSSDSAARDVQSITGPGNLTATLIEHAVRSERANLPLDFAMLGEWPNVARSEWPLAYRSDLRNWRNWVRTSDSAAMTPGPENQA